MADQALFERHPLPWGFGQSMPGRWCVFDCHMSLVLATSDPHPGLCEFIVRSTEMAVRIRQLMDEREVHLAEIERLRADVNHWEQKAVARGVRLGELEQQCQMLNDIIRRQGIEIRELRSTGGRCGGGL